MNLQAFDHPKALFDHVAADGDERARVTVHLQGGTTISGTVGPTGNHAVVIRALSGKEFFDAYVRYDAIACVEVQTRS